MQRSRQTPASNTYVYAGERFSDSDDEDSESDDETKHEQYHDAYSVFEACFNDASTSSSVPWDGTDPNHETPTKSSASNSEDESFSYPLVEEDQKQNLEAIIRALASDSNPSSSTTTNTTIPARSQSTIKWSTFTLQEYESLHLLRPSFHLPPSRFTKSRKKHQHVHNTAAHGKGDSGFDETVVPTERMVTYSPPQERGWTSYKPLPVIDNQTGLIKSATPPIQSLQPRIRQFRQPVFPVVVRQDMCPSSDDDEEDEDEEDASRQEAANKENVAPYRIDQANWQPSKSKGTSERIEIASHTECPISSMAAIQIPAVPTNSSSILDSSLGADSPMLREQKAWADFQPVRSKNTSFEKYGANSARLLQPSWDRPRIANKDRKMYDTASSILSEPTSLRDTHHTDGSTTSGGSSSISEASSTPEAHEDEDEDAENFEDAQYDNSIFQMDDTARDTHAPLAPLSSVQLDPVLDGLSLWKIRTSPRTEELPGCVDIPPSSSLLQERMTVLQSTNDAVPLPTQSIPSDIAYGWGPEEDLSSPIEQTPEVQAATKKGIGWDDDDDSRTNSKIEDTSSAWELAKIPTPGYPVSSKNRSPTNSGAHPERQLAPSLDLLRARGERSYSNTKKEPAPLENPDIFTNGMKDKANGCSNTLATPEVDQFSYAAEKGSRPSGITSIIREPAIPNSSSGGFSRRALVSPSRLF